MRYAPALLLLALTACSPKEKPAPAPAKAPDAATQAAAAPAPKAAAPTEDPAALEARARGKAAVLPFKKALLGALQTAMTEGGPEAAVTACQTKAPAIAAADYPGVKRIGRTSTKLRNPTNTAPAWVAPHLAPMASVPADQAKPVLVDLPDGGKGYIEPLYVLPLCTQCHGDTLAEGVKSKLAALYPTDQATGYAPGDFRGVVWAELAP